MYWKAYAVGLLHWASRAPAGHGQGCSCGPEKIGPPFGWLTTVVDVDGPPGNAAVTVFDPSASPPSSPSNAPFGRSANWPVTSAPFRPTFTREASAGFGRSIDTSACPPETRSARVDSTLICSPDAVAVDAADAAPATRPASAFPTRRTRIVSP